MRLLSLLFFCVLLAGSSQAQERVRNVRIRVADSSRIDVLYDMINTRFGDSVYLDVRSRLRGTLRISPEFVRGDVGMQITAGSDKRISWNAVANGYVLDEEIQARVLVKTGVNASAAGSVFREPVIAQTPIVEAPSRPQSRPNVQSVPAKPALVDVDSVPVRKENSIAMPPVATPPQKKAGRARPSVFAVDSVQSQPAPTPSVVAVPAPQRTDSLAKAAVQLVEAAPVRTTGKSAWRSLSLYNGPGWALVSAVAPGIGNIFVQTPKPKIGLRPIVTVGCYGLLIYGFMERTKAQDVYRIYEQQKNITAGEPYYQTANGHHQRYFLATRTALVVAATDVVLTFIKGLRNSQIRKENQRFNSLMFRPGLQAGQPTAVVHYSF